MCIDACIAMCIDMCIAMCTYRPAYKHVYISLCLCLCLCLSMYMSIHLFIDMCIDMCINIPWSSSGRGRTERAAGRVSGVHIGQILGTTSAKTLGTTSARHLAAIPLLPAGSSLFCNDVSARCRWPVGPRPLRVVSAGKGRSGRFRHAFQTCV